MMPLLMARRGETNKISAVRGKDEIKRFLANLGFVEGSAVTVISEIDGNLIVNVKDARIALSKQMAAKIFIEASGGCYENIKRSSCW